MILIYKKMLLSISEEKTNKIPPKWPGILLLSLAGRHSRWLIGGFPKTGLEDVIAVAEVSPRTFCSMRL